MAVLTNTAIDTLIFFYPTLHKQCKILIFKIVLIAPSIFIYKVIQANNPISSYVYVQVIIYYALKFTESRFCAISNFTSCPMNLYRRAIFIIYIFTHAHSKGDTPSFNYISNIKVFVPNHHSIPAVFYILIIHISKSNNTYIGVKWNKHKFMSQKVMKKTKLTTNVLPRIAFFDFYVNCLHCIYIYNGETHKPEKSIKFSFSFRYFNDHEELSFFIITKNRRRKSLVRNFNWNKIIRLNTIINIINRFIIIQLFFCITDNKFRVNKWVRNISHNCAKLLVITPQTHVEGIRTFEIIRHSICFVIDKNLFLMLYSILCINSVMLIPMSEKTFYSVGNTILNFRMVYKISKVYVLHSKTLLICNPNSCHIPIASKEILFIFISKGLFACSMFLAVNLDCKMIKRNIEINITPFSLAVIETLFSLMVNMCFIKQLLKVRLCCTMFIKEFSFPFYKLRANAFESFNLFLAEIFCVKFKIHKSRLFNETKFLTSHKGIPTLSPQLYIERVKGEILSFSVFTYPSFILNILVRISSKSSHLIPCIEGCPLTSLSNRLLASRLSPSSSVGGTLRGLAPEGRIYQSEQFYISAKTTEEGLHGLNLVCMGIKIPCKSHWRRAGLDAGYKLTLFQKVFYRYPFILPPSRSPQKAIAVQKYIKIQNEARNVKTPLTFWRKNNIRKIAARRKSVIYNDLQFRKLSNIAKSKDERWCKTPYLSGLPP